MSNSSFFFTNYDFNVGSLLVSVNKERRERDGDLVYKLYNKNRREHQAGDGEKMVKKIHQVANRGPLGCTRQAMRIPETGF